MIEEESQVNPLPLEFKKRYSHHHWLYNRQTYIKRITNISITQTYSYTAHASKQQISYIRKLLSISEIRQRIIFIDCAFISGEFELVNRRRKGNTLLSSICMMDYAGNIILDTRVTPSQKIRMYHTRITGFRPSDLLNQMKEEDIIQEVN